MGQVRSVAASVIRESGVSYSLEIGVRYLRSKKRATVSMITLISIVGVALGVAALLAVLSITTGFEQVFKDRVLGVNAHVLILKYGREFRDYRDVLGTVGDMPEVSGIAPFSINEMMLTKGERRAVVLVKGVTDAGVQNVLDLPQQMIAGDLEGLARAGARPEEARTPTTDATWQWLRDARDRERAGEEPALQPVNTGEVEEKPVESTAPGRTPYWEQEQARLDAERDAARRARRPKVGAVAKPGAIEAMLGELDDDALALPDDRLLAGVERVLLPPVVPLFVAWPAHVTGGWRVLVDACRAASRSVI